LRSWNIGKLVVFSHDLWICFYLNYEE
jgi:hypothetical protein